jgi:hypothetical protein
MCGVSALEGGVNPYKPDTYIYIYGHSQILNVTAVSKDLLGSLYYVKHVCVNNRWYL